MVTIRDANENDTASLIALFQQLGYSMVPDELTLLLQEKNASSCSLVAVLKQQICGVIVINFIEPMHEKGRWGLISALIVDEAYRSAGTGRKLLIEAERVAVARGCTQIELSSSEKRLKAHQFYQNNGYQEVRKRFLKKVS